MYIQCLMSPICPLVFLYDEWGQSHLLRPQLSKARRSSARAKVECQYYPEDLVFYKIISTSVNWASSTQRLILQFVCIAKYLANYLLCSVIVFSCIWRFCNLAKTNFLLINYFKIIYCIFIWRFWIKRHHASYGRMSGYTHFSHSSLYISDSEQ